MQISALRALANFGAQVQQAAEHLSAERVYERILARDHTVWRPDPTEIANRLGWLDSPRVMRDEIDPIRQFIDAVRADGYTHALLLGMGGSSLAPEVFRAVFGVADGFLDLSVLDSTQPDTVLAKARALDPARTLFLPATKSGGTVETLSLLKYFYNRTADALGPAEAGRHFAAITDPGSGLEALAQRLGFRHIFRNDPNIGGRYSALSYYGLVAAGAIGADLDRLLDRAEQALTDPQPGIQLGAFLGAGALAGRDKLTLITSPAASAVGAWIEQLIAESTGKDGKGLLPVDLEPECAAHTYGDDRLFVHLRLDDADDVRAQAIAAAGHPILCLQLADDDDLGAAFFYWEIATSIAGFFLDIHPFGPARCRGSEGTGPPDGGRLPATRRVARPRSRPCRWPRAIRTSAGHHPATGLGALSGKRRAKTRVHCSASSPPADPRDHRRPPRLAPPATNTHRPSHDPRLWAALPALDWPTAQGRRRTRAFYAANGRLSRGRADSRRSRSLGL